MSKMTIVALVAVLIIAAGGYMFPKVQSGLLGSTSCGSITCLAGGLRLVSDLGGAFESDVAATLASVVVTAGETVGTTLQVTGLTSLSTLNTTGRIAVATTSPSSMGDVVVSSTGTSTLMLSSSGTGTQGGCLQIENSAGTLTRAYILGTTWVIEAGSCK